MNPKGAALSDFITFNCEPQTVYVDVTAEALERRIAEFTGIDEKHTLRSMLTSFCIIYYCTTSVEFHFSGLEHQALRDFRDRWEMRDAMTPTDLWDMRIKSPHNLWNEWSRQWSRAQQLFDVDPAQLPEGGLTAEQRKELKDPNSPLAEKEGGLPSA